MAEKEIKNEGTGGNRVPWFVGKATGASIPVCGKVDPKGSGTVRLEYAPDYNYKKPMKGTVTIDLEYYHKLVDTEKEYNEIVNHSRRNQSSMAQSSVKEDSDDEELMAEGYRNVVDVQNEYLIKDIGALLQCSFDMLTSLHGIKSHEELCSILNERVKLGILQLVEIKALGKTVKSFGLKYERVQKEERS